jgi:8-oxo-dGTP pyrophosphatase MutT (NUDIX family)
MTTAPATPLDAASVVPIRDADTGPEVLLLERNSSLSFAAGAWVFPGGRVDAADRDDASDPMSALRHAAVREAGEEAGLNVDETDLVPLAHWVPPIQAAKRFDTWLFIVAVSSTAAVVIDDSEIVAHRWMRPTDALRECEAGDFRLFPPTWIALWDLAQYPSTATALADVRRLGPRYFVPRVVVHEGTRVALYQGDAGYAEEDPSRAGPRHRLAMSESGWRYVRDR